MSESQPNGRLDGKGLDPGRVCVLQSSDAGGRGPTRLKGRTPDTLRPGAKDWRSERPAPAPAPAADSTPKSNGAARAASATEAPRVKRMVARANAEKTRPEKPAMVRSSSLPCLRRLLRYSESLVGVCSRAGWLSTFPASLCHFVSSRGLTCRQPEVPCPRLTSQPPPPSPPAPPRPRPHSEDCASASHFACAARVVEASRQVENAPCQPPPTTGPPPPGARRRCCCPAAAPALPPPRLPG